MSDNTTYSIEYAKSGRSSCKRCKEKIDKGTLRIQTTVARDDTHSMASSTHPSCFNLPRKYATGANKISAEQFVDDILQDSDGSILPAKRDELIAAIESHPRKKKKEPMSGDGDSAEAILFRIKAALEADEKEPAAKKIKLDVSSSNADREAAMTQAYAKYSKLKNDELKDYLRWNRQMVGGNKSYVLIKILDGHTCGRLARCGQCGGGRLKLVEDDCHMVACNGKYDEELNMRLPCSFKGPASEAPRWEPWFTNEPSESENKEMDRLEADAAGEDVAAADGKDSPKVSALKAAVSKLNNNWVLTSRSGKRAAAMEMIKILRSTEPKVDLPTDEMEALQAIGLIITAGGKDSRPEDVIPEIVKKFSFAKEKAEKEAKRVEAVSETVKNPKNGSLIKAIHELSQLYYKEGNRNAGGAYVKVAKALSEIEFEITQENALGLGKGKNKFAGIGPGSAKKIEEFCRTGTIEKLEEKRASLG